MHGIQCGEVEFQNCSSLVDSWYITVRTGTYWYVLVHWQTETKQHTSLDHALSAFLRLRVSAERLAWSFRTVSFRMAVSSTVRPPRRGLPLPKFHSQVLISYTSSGILTTWIWQNYTDMSEPCTDMFVLVQECKTCMYMVCTCLYHVHKNM